MQSSGMIIEKLSRKNKNTKDHTQKYRKYFALNRNGAGFTSDLKEITYTLLSEKASGPYLYDIDGNKYIDLTMGFGAILFGHNYPPIREAIIRQLDINWSVGAMTPLAGQLAKEISRVTGVQRVAFFNSGTEAIMVALRLAKAARKKTHIVFFKGSYHGTFDSLLSISRDEESFIAREIIPGVTQSVLNESYLLDFGSEESLEFIRKNKDNIAAVLTEPVQSRNPGFQPKEYLQQLRQLTRENDIALIFDEVITGFRADLGGAQKYFGIEADLVTYGKVIGGGLPIGIVAGKREYLDTTDGGFWQYEDDSGPMVKTTFVAGTFCHHPLAMASCLKMLELLQEDENILPFLNKRTQAFVHRMNDFFSEQEFNLSISGFASLFRFNTPGKSKMIYPQLLLNDVYIWEGRNCFLSPSHDDAVVEELEDKIKLSCHQLREDGIIK